MSVKQILQTVNEQNHDAVCTTLKGILNPTIFSTLKYSGKLCATDGSQLIELAKVEGGYSGLDNIKIIDLPSEEELDKIEVLDTDLDTKLLNMANILGSVGAPLDTIITWVRLCLVVEGENILLESDALKKAYARCLREILRLDETKIWLINACCHFCADVTDVDKDEVLTQFLSWDVEEQNNFIKDTAISMGFTVQ